jgi:hypothetical protein
MNKGSGNVVSGTMVFCLYVWILLSGAFLGANAAEPTNESRTEELDKETQNTVSNLISVPFQNSFNFGIGPNDIPEEISLA